MDDQDREKMACFFKGKKKKKDRESQERRKKTLDGDSGESEGMEDECKDSTGHTQAGAFKSLTSLGTTTRTSSSRKDFINYYR
jgi:hypothetical protein